MTEKQKPLVSTITPSFRMERYLKEFLDQLPNQTIFDRLQVVLDHNEPTEQELKWVAEFQEKHPGVLKHIVVNPVEPIGTSMNRCIREADADVVCIWNVDDLRPPDSLESQLVVLQNEDCDVTYGNFIIVNKFPATEGRFVNQAWYDQWQIEYTRSMILGPFPMWKKALCDKAGLFDENLKSGADFDLAIRLAIHGKVKPTRKVVGYYLDEGRGASTRGDGRQPTERTVIELRYGILDKIDTRFIPKAVTEFNIRSISFGGKSYHVTDFVPDYDQFLKKNRTTDRVDPP